MTRPGWSGSASLGLSVCLSVKHTSQRSVEGRNCYKEAIARRGRGSSGCCCKGSFRAHFAGGLDGIHGGPVGWDEGKGSQG